MNNNLETFPKECSTDPCDQWLIAFKQELEARIKKNEITVEYMKTKGGLIHNTMILMTQSENDLIREIIGQTNNDNKTKEE